VVWSTVLHELPVLKAAARHAQANLGA
jgi:hypothetical protein